MIRIDLGKGDSPKKGDLNSVINKVLAKLPPGLVAALKRGGGGPGGGNAKLTNDIKTLFIIGLTIALACLPHLFFTQFRAYVIEEHQQQMKKLEETRVALNQEVEKLGPFQKELESYDQQKRLVRDRLEIVRDLLQGRGTPVSVLDAIGQSLPQRAWLDSIDFTVAPGGTGVRLSGKSFTNEDVSDFLDKLSESVHLTDVKLEEVGTGRTGRVDMKTFRISAMPRARMASRKPAGPTDAGINEAPAVPPAGVNPPPNPNPPADPNEKGAN